MKKADKSSPAGTTDDSSTNVGVEQVSQPIAKPNVSGSLCCCINWHPSVKQDQGKRAICSYCNKPRRNDLIEEIKRRRDLILSEPDGIVRETMINNLLLDI